MAAGEGGRFSVSAVDSASPHQPESEVLLRAGAGTNEVRGQAGDLFAFAGTADRAQGRRVPRPSYGFDGGGTRARRGGWLEKQKEGEGEEDANEDEINNCQGWKKQEGKEERDNNKRRRAAGPAAGLQHRSRRLLRTARCLAYGLGGGVPFAGWGWRFVRHLASRLSCGSTTRAGTG